MACPILLEKLVKVPRAVILASSIFNLSRYYMLNVLEYSE